jgi:geranylgeranyl pyrophosphate synthase
VGIALIPVRVFNLAQFRALLADHTDDMVRNELFDVSQRDLLLKTVAACRPTAAENALCDPLALFYLIARACGAKLDQQAVELASFCQFYILSLDAFDDVQDDDLAGKPYEHVGAPLATNTAIALMFLALRALARAMELERDPARRMAYLKLLNEKSMLAVAGQHRDLLGEIGAKSPVDVLAMQQAKTSSLVLVCECAAIFSRASERDCTRYCRIGENLALLVQVVDDMRDVFGKRVSPDLATGKMTYPLACFLERAGTEERARFEQLKAELPGSLPAVRRLFYDAGVVRRVAGSLEEFRRSVIAELVATENYSAPHRTLAFIIDGLVSTIYRPRPIPGASRLNRPEGAWHSRVRDLAADFVLRTQDLGMPAAPELIPWHLPQWMYDPDRGVIFYPDIEGQPEETLPLQAELLGTMDLEEARAAVEATAPVVLAHELVHFWRHRMNRLGDDRWHEELVANTVALSYCRTFQYTALESTLELARRVLRPSEVSMPPAGRAILERLFSNGTAQPGGKEYGVGLVEMALVHLAMVLRLSEAVLPLPSVVERYLMISGEKAA